VTRVVTRIALLQMTSGIDPAANAKAICEAVEESAKGGAAMLFTPEMAGLLDRDRKRAAANIVGEADNLVLAAVKEAAAQANIWVHLGSIPVLKQDGRWANRCLVIDNTGAVAARYDKIHMFDVELASGESWRESNAYAAGDRAVSLGTPVGRLGLGICYDMRFPALATQLGAMGVDAIAYPSAFTVPTGRAHWHILLRARAIEATAFVIAPAQVGAHADGRETFGHSLVVDPWGEVLLDMGDAPGLGYADIDSDMVNRIRAQIPSLANRTEISISDRL
jgi:deaminated glutathione amidase